MGEAIDRLAVKLTRVWVPPHIRMQNGKRTHVEGYYRTVQPGFRGTVDVGGGPAEGMASWVESGMGPARTVEYGDLSTQGRPRVSGPITSLTQDDGVVLKRGQAYQWETSGSTYTGVFSGLASGGRNANEDYPLFRDVEVTLPNGDKSSTHARTGPRSGVRALEDIDEEVRAEAQAKGMSPIEYLRWKRRQRRG